MATATGSIVQNTPTANASVTSLKPISDLLQAMVTAGTLTQTSDTGQVSWGSVAANQTSTNNYEIFKLNDSLNATFPIFMKFVYATQVTGNTPKVSIQIGTGSDGAGNLTGASAATFFRGLSNVADTNSTTIYCSAGDGYLNIWGGFNATVTTANSGNFALAIERLRDSSGAITGDGISVCGTFHYSSGSFAPVNPGNVSAGTVAANTHIIAAHMSALRASFSTLFSNSNNVWPPMSNRGASNNFSPMYDGTNFLAATIQPYAGKLYGPITGILFVDNNFPFVTNASMTIYATSHNYLSTQTNMPSAWPTAANLGTNATPSSLLITAGASNIYPAFRYE